MTQAQTITFVGHTTVIPVADPKPMPWILPVKLTESEHATLTRILGAKYDMVPHRMFRYANAPRKVFDEAAPVPRPDTSWYHPVLDTAAVTRAPKSPGAVPLTAAQERALFLQFNYCRWRVNHLKKQLPAGNVRYTQAREILHWHARAEGYRDQVAQTNLALVLAMAKRTRMSEVDFSDLVSEGNMALLRAIDKFDVSRGFKFSTYACRAIIKAFSRMGLKLAKYRLYFPTDFDPKLERSDFIESKREDHRDDCVDEVRRIIKENRADLTPIEREVIVHRFAIGQPAPVSADPSAPALTLEQVGQIIGVTKERVRQIQNKALDKIRQTLEDGFLT